MIQRIRIENFRALRSLSLDKLGGVNIIVGPNASGKTSLLEALFLVLGSSLENSLKLRRWRGIVESTSPVLAISPGSQAWEDLFFDTGKPGFSVEIDDSKAGRRRLEVTLTSDQSVTLPFEESVRASKIPSIPISFTWVINEQRYDCPVEATEDGYKIGRVPNFTMSAFMSTKGGGPSENAARFSSLSKQNREQEVVDGIQTIFPYIEKLSVETETGGGACIYASIKGHKKKLPLPDVSEGINKYLSLLLAICSAKDGVVLIDEVEGGFFHQILETVWKGLLTFAKKYGTQVFIATHSMEALQALKHSIESDPDNFSLLRMKRDEATGACTAKQVSGKRIAAALDEGFEIR